MGAFFAVVCASVHAVCKVLYFMTMVAVSLASPFRYRWQCAKHPASAGLFLQSSAPLQIVELSFHFPVIINMTEN